MDTLDSGPILRELFEWSQINQASLPEIFPYKHENEWHWLSPWGLLNNQLLHVSGFNSSITYLDEMRDAFLEGDEALFSQNADSLALSIAKTDSQEAYRAGAIKAESIYNKMRPFILSQLLFGLGLLLAL